MGAGLKYIDIGGGLGVDYDGSKTDFGSSVNYGLQEYANDVIFHVKEICDQKQVEHPTIISESGRAMVAYHSVLVFNVLGWSGFERFDVPDHSCRRAAGRHAGAGGQSVRYLPRRERQPISWNITMTPSSPRNRC